MTTRVLSSRLSLLIAAGCLLVAWNAGAAAKKPAKMAPSPKIPPGKPEIFRLDPRGIQRGSPAKIKLIGTNLIGLTELKLHDPNLKGAFLDEPEATTEEVWIELTAATNLARGAYELSVTNTNSESSRLKLYVDDLPQVYEADLKTWKRSSPKLATPEPLKLPVSFVRFQDPFIHKILCIRLVPFKITGIIHPPCQC